MALDDRCLATAYGADGWSDLEQEFFDEVVQTGTRSALPLMLDPILFDRLLDMMTRFPAVPQTDDDDEEMVIINAAVSDPQDHRLHLVIRGRKVFKLRWRS